MNREPWRSDESHNAITGAGNDVASSDAFDHWRALLGVISLVEEGE